MDTNDCIHEWQYGRDHDVCVKCGLYAVFPARTDAQMRATEAAKREQQARRFDADPGDCVSFESYIFGAVFPTPAAMSADAGSIGETRTDRRIKYEITSERTKQTIIDDLAEALVAHKWSHLGLDEAIERVTAIVLDTVAA